MLADQPFEGRDPRFVLLKEVGRGSVLVEGARLVSFDPDTDQIAREIMALLQTVERFASQKLLRDPPMVMKTALARFICSSIRSGMFAVPCGSRPSSARSHRSRHSLISDRCQTGLRQSEFPANREKNRDFVQKWVPARDFVANSLFMTVGCRTIPYEAKQGINSQKQGASFRQQGMAPDLKDLPDLRCRKATIVLWTRSMFSLCSRLN